MQPELFTNLPPAQIPNVTAYHDESGHVGKDQRFLFHGVLFVPRDKSDAVLKALRHARGRHTGSIHYTDLQDRDRDKSEAARAWMDTYGKALSGLCCYKCFIVDMDSPTFDRSHYTENYHIYNHFAATAIWSGLRWSYIDTRTLRMQIVSEEMSRKPEDNFVSYVPTQLSNKASGTMELIFENPALITVSGDPSMVSTDYQHHCEFLQLTDLLTSSIAEAVQAKANRTIKQDLAQQIGQWIADTREMPWLQERDLHRRFSVSCYPNENGGFYDIDLAIKKRQQDALL